VSSFVAKLKPTRGTIQTDESRGPLLTKRQQLCWGFCHGGGNPRSESKQPPVSQVGFRGPFEINGLAVRNYHVYASNRGRGYPRQTLLQG